VVRGRLRLIIGCPHQAETTVETNTSLFTICFHRLKLLKRKLRNGSRALAVLRMDYSPLNTTNDFTIEMRMGQQFAGP
jgi:hypothetical protein